MAASGPASSGFRPLIERCGWLACLLAAWMLLPPPALACAGPPLWRIDGRHGTLTLYGSMHLLPPGEFALDGALARAYRDAAEVYFEVDFDRFSAAELAATTAARAIDPEHRTLEELLGEDAPRVRAAAEAQQLDLAPYAAFEPWFVGLAVTALALERHGYRQSAGVEQVIRLQARQDAKPLYGLETLDQQLALMDALPAHRQREFLLKSLEDGAGQGAELQALLQAWRCGDDAALLAHLRRDFADAPELVEPLIHARNDRWMAKLEELLDGSGDKLVVVGALHLIGEQGLLAMLERRGWQVEPF